MVSFLIKALPDDANDGIRAQLPDGRGREALATRWLCIMALGPERALAILHIQRTAQRTAQRRRGETQLQSQENILTQYSRKVDRFHDVLRAYQEQYLYSYGEEQPHIPPFVEVVDRLCAILYYVGQDFLHHLSVETLNELSTNYCKRISLSEEVAWECTWRKYEDRSYHPLEWRSQHLELAVENERVLLQNTLDRILGKEKWGSPTL